MIFPPCFLAAILGTLAPNLETTTLEQEPCSLGPWFLGLGETCSSCVGSKE